MTRYAHVCIHIHTCSLALFTKGLRTWDIPMAMSTPVPRPWFLNIILSIKGDRAPWRNGEYQGGGKDSKRRVWKILY